MFKKSDLAVFGAELLHRFAMRLARRKRCAECDAAKVKVPILTSDDPPKNAGMMLQSSSPQHVAKSDQTKHTLDGFGIEFHFLSQVELSQRSVSATTGILVTAIAANSIADRSGLQIGMVITDILRAEEEKPEGCVDEPEESTQSRLWFIRIWNNDGSRFICSGSHLRIPTSGIRFPCESHQQRK